MSRSLVASTAVAASLALLAAGCAGGGDAKEGASGATSGASKCSGAIGVMAPITGGAAAIGGEQLNFAKLAVDDFNTAQGTDFTIAEGDTQLEPGQASTVAQQFVSNKDILAVVGPAGSQEVEAVGPAFKDASLGFISASATSTDLTGGQFPTYFRVIPSDAVQGPTDADYMVNELGAKKIVIFEEKTSYGKGLADALDAALKDKGVSVSRIEVAGKQADYSAVVSKVSGDTDVVFGTLQIAANTNLLAEQLKAQGKKAIVFASDGSFSADFKVPGSYVSSFAPDVSGIESSKQLADEYTKKYGKFGTFGPPVHAATQAALEAMKRACDVKKLTRDGVLSEIKNTNISMSILGGPLKFTSNGEVEGAKFYIFKLNADGAPELVQ
jgi:branched-chain amino acid transport system substrate-binding protein